MADGAHKDIYEQLYRLAGGQENMNLRLEELGGAIRGLDCKAHEARLAMLEGKAAVESAVKEVTGKFKIPTSEQPPTVDRVANALEKREREKQRDRRNTIAQWVSIIVGLLTILSAFGGMTMFVMKLSRKLDAQPDEMRSLLAAHGQRVVYVTVPQRVDAGTEPIQPLPKRPRRK